MHLYVKFKKLSDINERSKRPCATTCVTNNDATHGRLNKIIKIEIEIYKVR